MKRWEIAKAKGLNWQVLLVQDCETDIKLTTLESVRRGEDYNTTNKKVLSLIKECVNNLESEYVKELVKSTLPLFASKIYLQWLNLFGNKAQGFVVLSLLAKKGIITPETTKMALSSLPKKRVIPDFVYNKATVNQTYSNNVDREIMGNINKVLGSNAKEDYSTRYSMRASVERQVRYEWQQNNLKKLYESGVDLVWIDTHANCSERCEPWQGKLYSISGKSGVIDGISYQPLSNATDRYETTKAGRTYINGTLTGFNCRHTTTPYKKGNKPRHIPSEVIERQRAIEIRQRELERRVRQYETNALGWKKIRVTALTDEDRAIADKLFKKNNYLAEKWQDEYKKFSRENNVAYYPSRLKV